MLPGVAVPRAAHTVAHRLGGYLQSQFMMTAPLLHARCLPDMIQAACEMKPDLIRHSLRKVDIGTETRSIVCVSSFPSTEARAGAASGRSSNGRTRAAPRSAPSSKKASSNSNSLSASSALANRDYGLDGKGEIGVRKDDMPDQVCF